MACSPVLDPDSNPIQTALTHLQRLFCMLTAIFLSHASLYSRLSEGLSGMGPSR